MFSPRTFNAGGGAGGNFGGAGGNFGNTAGVGGLGPAGAGGFGNGAGGGNFETLVSPSSMSRNSQVGGGGGGGSPMAGGGGFGIPMPGGGGARSPPVGGGGGGGFGSPVAGAGGFCPPQFGGGGPVSPRADGNGFGFPTADERVSLGPFGPVVNGPAPNGGAFGGLGNFAGAFGTDRAGVVGGLSPEITAGWPVVSTNVGAGYAVGVEGGVPQGCATGCSRSGCAEVAANAMTYVGEGLGDYDAVTTYRFVGRGQGRLAIIPRMRMNWATMLAALGLLAALLALALHASPGTPTTTKKGVLPDVRPLEHEVEKHQVAAVFGECTFWGDPHFKTFDGARPSFYGEGELYIVKSNLINIQGRYRGTKYTAGLAATNKIAVGGDFIHGHTIEVGCMETGDITLDGEPILTSFPSTYTLLDVPDAKITYSTAGELVDKATEMFDERHIVHMELPMGVRLTVLRWGNYVDFRLGMQQQHDQDGGCGNFNNDPSDDTTEEIFRRDGARVKDGELLFRNRVDVRMGYTELKLLNVCPEEQMKKAKAACVEELSGIKGAAQDEVQLQSCYLDVCFGSNEHTLKMSKKLGLTEEED